MIARLDQVQQRPGAVSPGDEVNVVFELLVAPPSVCRLEQCVLQSSVKCTYEDARITVHVGCARNHRYSSNTDETNGLRGSGVGAADVLSHTDLVGPADPAAWQRLVIPVGDVSTDHRAYDVYLGDVYWQTLPLINTRTGRRCVIN
jgi:hypothetical protein